MHTEVAVIGGGSAGLAMSRCLSGRAIDHVVLERGEVANLGGMNAGIRSVCSRRTG
jgi:cation diffusion facilitator CzcD-associated flavoprotein CzcO